MVYTLRLHIHHPKVVIPTLSSLFSGNKTQEWFFENNWDTLLHQQKTLLMKIARFDIRKTALFLKNNLKRTSSRPFSNYQLRSEFCVKVSDCHYRFQLSLSFQGSFQSFCLCAEMTWPEEFNSQLMLSQFRVGFRYI